MSINQPLLKLNSNKYGVYYLRFRIAKKLIRFFGQTYINKSLNTSDHSRAKRKAIHYRTKYLELLDVSDWISDKTLQDSVDNYKFEVLKLPKEENNRTLDYRKLSIQQAYNLFDKWYKKQNILEQQYKVVTKRLSIAISYFGENTPITKLTTDDIEEYIDFLSAFPNPIKKPYKTMSFKEIRNLTNIPNKDLISSSTVIKYIKAFRQFESFLVDDGKLHRRISKRANLPTPSTVNVNPFTQTDLKTLFDEFNKIGDLGLIYYTYAYTGMRTSEFWKSRIGYIDGIYYFDLSYKGVELKTSSSKRKIPIHSKLIDMGILKSLERLQKSYKQSMVSNTFNNKLINSILDTKNKVLYGFRHTFATELKKANVNIDKISEILGHHYENTSTTKEVYTNGYSLQQLREAVETLSL